MFVPSASLKYKTFFIKKLWKPECCFRCRLIWKTNILQILRSKEGIKGKKLEVNALKAAVNAVKNENVHVRSAAKIFNTSRTTLKKSPETKWRWWCLWGVLERTRADSMWIFNNW